MGLEIIGRFTLGINDNRLIDRLPISSTSTVIIGRRAEIIRRSGRSENDWSVSPSPLGITISIDNHIGLHGVDIGIDHAGSSRLVAGEVGRTDQISAVMGNFLRGGKSGGSIGMSEILPVGARIARELDIAEGSIVGGSNN